MRKNPRKRARRRRTCARCGARLARNIRGRPRAYCSRSCQQRAYEQRKRENARDRGLEALRGDLKGARISTEVREEVRHVLAALGFLQPSPPPLATRKPRARHLRSVK